MKKVLLKIPDEFAEDLSNKFQDYLSRVLVDIKDGVLCGNYERETTEMFIKAFDGCKVLNEQGSTNLDVYKDIFPSSVEVTRELSSASDMIVMRDDSFLGAINRLHYDWCNREYNDEVEDE